VKDNFTVSTSASSFTRRYSGLTLSIGQFTECNKLSKVCRFYLSLPEMSTHLRSSDQMKGTQAWPRHFFQCRLIPGFVLLCADELYLSDGPYCEGKYEDRKRKLALFRKPFDDLEPGCVIKPISTEHETHTQIGRANRGESYFAVYLWNKPMESPGKIFFGLDFINDGTKKDRFQSAMFQVTFGYHDADKTHLPINLKDMFPTSAEQLVSHTEFDADLGIDLESDSASTRSQERVNEVFISGQGRHSPTATWNFVEAIDGGLNAHYLVSVSLPTTNKIWMKFYGKAVHVRGGLTLGTGRAIIQVGSLEKPYERILDLSEVI
jgi:hypothetical protein